MPSVTESIAETCQRINGQFRGGHFDPFIRFIEFPNYRSFERGTRVTFNFPLTVIVGQNGTGKSSLLHALYGAPLNQQLGRWWFGTALDPMDDDELLRAGKRKTLTADEKASLWYRYTMNGETFDAVKMRVRRQGDPDYWEPSRLIKGFGMELTPKALLDDDRDRDPQIKIDSIYMNFKTQIGAFDRCFYFNSPESISKVRKSAFWENITRNYKKRSARIQDYLRWRSKKLRSALVDGETVWPHRKFHKKRVTLTQGELHEISTIVGRHYESGQLLEHRFYETWGISVMFNTERRSYSDAFAGSGESAVVRLVHEIEISQPGRLILLDEPETSLHPGAQERLLEFLLRRIEEKKLQVVISTHSPAIVRPLPSQAIRVMVLGEDNSVRARDADNADEAFFVLGHPPEDRIQIIVEDQLAKDFVDAVLMTTDDAFRVRFACVYRPGGHSAMKQDAATYMRDDEIRRVFLFDGDQEECITGFGLGNISLDDTAEDIDEKIKKWLGVAVSLHQNSNMEESAKVQLRKDFLQFVKKAFRCFPFQIPEQAIWSDQVAENLLQLSGEQERMGELLGIVDFKQRFAFLCEATQPEGSMIRGSHIQYVHNLFLKNFCESGSDDYKNSVALLREIASNA